MGAVVLREKKNKCNMYSYEAFTSNKPLFLMSNIIFHCLVTKYISHMCLLSLLLCSKYNHWVFSLPYLVCFTGNQLIFVVCSVLYMLKAENTSFLVRYTPFLQHQSTSTLEKCYSQLKISNHLLIKQTYMGAEQVEMTEITGNRFILH